MHLEDEGTFPKVHWRILEDSGRLIARIPRWLGLNGEGLLLCFTPKFSVTDDTHILNNAQFA